MENYVYDIDSIRGINLNLKVPYPLFAYLIEEIFKFTLNQPSAFSTPYFLQIFTRESVPLSEDESLFCINSLVYFVKYLQNNQIAPDNLNRWVKENTLMPDEHRQYLAQLYTNLSAEEQAKKVLHLGKLKELKWTVNSYCGDAKYPNLKKIYILLEFHIQNEEGDLEKQLINLTLQEFKVLQTEFKEIGEILTSFSI